MSEQNKNVSAVEWEDIPAEKFEIIGTDDFSGDIIARPKVSYWADAWRRFRENKIALVALIILVIMVIMVIIGPGISGYNFEQRNTDEINQLPSAEHWFGTDDLAATCLPVFPGWPRIADHRYCRRGCLPALWAVSMAVLPPILAASWTIS